MLSFNMLHAEAARLLGYHTHNHTQPHTHTQHTDTHTGRINLYGSCTCRVISRDFTAEFRSRWTPSFRSSINRSESLRERSSSDCSRTLSSSDFTSANLAHSSSAVTERKKGKEEMNEKEGRERGERRVSVQGQSVCVDLI